MGEAAIFALAESYYRILKLYDKFICEPQFVEFTIPMPDNTVQATVFVKYGQIKEIQLKYNNNITQTIRPDTTANQ